MIICICTNYKTSHMVKDIEAGLSLKDIVKQQDLKDRCTKCCKTFKEEYNRLSAEKVILIAS